MNAYLAKNGSVTVVVLKQTKTETTYTAIRSGTLCVTRVATNVFKGKYPEVVTDAVEVRDSARQLLNPPKGVKIENAAKEALSAIASTLLKDDTMKPTKPAATKPAATKPGKPAAAPAAAKSGTKVASTKPAPSAPAPEAEKKGGRGYGGKSYTVNAGAENKSREGTWTHDMVEALLTNDTVDAANAAVKDKGHEKTVDIGWAIAKGYITLDD